MAFQALSIGMLFPTTNWSQWAAHSQSGDHLAKEAMEQLCKNYWRPVHFIVRSRVSSDHDAEDLTQSFFQHAIERMAFERADRLKGRFRDYLRAVLNRFMSTERRALLSQKRGGGVPHEVLDDEQLPATETAEDAEIFDREWAHLVMSAALAATRAACEDKGRSWEVFQSF